MEQFRLEPLSLQQLARIAIRRTVGSADFARQVNRLADIMPASLLQYVEEPTELIVSDSERRIVELKTELHSIHLLVIFNRLYGLIRSTDFICFSLTMAYGKGRNFHYQGDSLVFNKLSRIYDNC